MLIPPSGRKNERFCLLGGAYCQLHGIHLGLAGYLGVGGKILGGSFPAGRGVVLHGLDHVFRRRLFLGNIPSPGKGILGPPVVDVNDFGG